MNNFKKIVKKTFFYKYLLTIKIFFRQLKKKTFKEATILLYHRVANVKDDPLSLSVSINNFENQLLYLKEKYKIISLSELIQKIKNHQSLGKCIVITFDDCYLDNYENALPILKKLEIPATFFVTGPYDQKNFYWENNTMEKDRGIPIEEKYLKLLSENDLVEIGGHTQNHLRLSTLSKEKQEEEIEKNKLWLESVTNKEILSFSYPFGSKDDYNQNSEIITQKLFTCVCINEFGYINNKTSIYKLPRNLVRNLDIANFKKYSL